MVVLEGTEQAFHRTKYDALYYDRPPHPRQSRLEYRNHTGRSVRENFHKIAAKSMEQLSAPGRKVAQQPEDLPPYPWVVLTSSNAERMRIHK